VYIRKTKDVYEIHGNYSYGYECVCCETTYSDAKANIKLYRENEKGVHFRIVKKRVKRV
jgi:NAD-dependent SIR2 family protein deacetylase